MTKNPMANDQSERRPACAGPARAVSARSTPEAGRGSAGFARPAAGRGFTLVELILVMALLVVFMAIIVPNVTHSLRQRNLEQEAARLLALTEYGRDEAASQGVPMDVWIDPDNKLFGVEPKAGYIGSTVRAKSFQLNAEMHFDPVSGGVTVRPGTGAGTKTPQGQAAHGGITAAEFAPDGTLDPTSVVSVRIADHAGDGVSVTQTADGYGYQIVKDAAP